MFEGNKKKFIIVGVILVFILLLLLLVTVLLKNSKTSIVPGIKSPKITSTTDQSPINNRITGTTNITPVGRKTQSLTIGENSTNTSGGLTKLQIAEKVLNYLNNMRDNRKTYLFWRQCSGPDIKTCQDSQLSNPSGPRPIWARLKYYEKNKNQKDLTIINSDLDIYLNKDIVWTIQNDFWNCKLMYNSWKDGPYDDIIKKKLYDLCHNSILNYSNSPQVDNIINTKYTVKPNFSQVISSNSYINPNYVEVDNNNNSGLLKTAFYSSEQSALYSFDKNITDITKALLFFNQALHMYFAQPLTDNPQAACVVGESAIDLYKNTNDKDYLDFAKYLWNREKLNEYDKSPDYFPAKVICGFFTNSLFKFTKDNKYKYVKDQYVNHLINNFFDYQNYDGKYINDGSFRDNIYNNTVVKYSNYNGLMVGLLLEE